MQNYSQPVKEEVWAKLFNIFDHYAHGNASITIPVLNQMIRDILKEDGNAEVAYMARNIAKIDTNNNGLIEFDEFANYLLKRHCGEMTLQKFHRGKVTKGGRMALSQSDFNQILNNAFSFLSLVVQPETSLKIFEFLDSDEDRLVTYTEYFRFVQAFICQTSLSLSQNQNKSRGSPHKITRPIEHSEMLILFRRLLWGQLFKIYIQYDQDGNGNMDESQMKEVLKEVLNQTSKSQLDYVFKNGFRMDLNNDNNFVFEEFAHFFIKHSCEIGLNRYNRSRPSGGRRDISNEDFVKLFRNSFCFLNVSIMSDKLVNKVFHKIDKDNDGIISYKQYLMWSNELLHYREKCGMPCFLSDPKVQEMAKTTPRKGYYDEYDVGQVSKFELDRELQNSRTLKYKQDRQREERDRYERELHELEKIQKEKHDRIERQKQDVYRHQYQKQQKERQDREKQERQRIERTRAQMEKYERQRREKEQKETEKTDRDRKQRFEDLRLKEEKENEAERLRRQDSSRKQKQIRDKRHWILDEEQRLERQRRAKLNAQARQREYRQKEQREKEERERIQREKNQREQRERYERYEREKKEKENLDRIERQRNQRIERERLERSRIQRERQERDRLQRQKAEQKRLDSQRLEEQRFNLEQQKRNNYNSDQQRFGSQTPNERSLNDSKQRQQYLTESQRQRRLEVQRLEQQRLEQQRIQNQRLEQLRLDQQRELQRREQQKQDNQRIQTQRIQRQRMQKEKSERQKLERQKLQQKIHEQRLENQRLEQQRLEQQRFEREKYQRERLERQRLERERQENIRIQREKLERERTERQRIERERQQQQIAERNQREWEKFQRERLQRDRLQQERVKRDMLERERQEREKREKQDRQQRQRQERERTRSTRHDNHGNSQNDTNQQIPSHTFHEVDQGERRARAATMGRPPLPQHTARDRLNKTIQNAHEQTRTQRAYSTSKLIDFSTKGCETVVIPSIRVNGSRVSNIPRLNISGRNFDTSSIASSGCSVRSFSSRGLAERIKQHTRKLFKSYDQNRNQLAEKHEIIDILRSILKEDEMEVKYVTRNFSRINWSQGQKIHYQTFLQFFLGLHCGEMALQRFHRKEMFYRGKEQVMPLKEFIMVFQGALDYLEFLAPMKELKQLFKEIDTDCDGLITYKEYFNFLTHFFGFLPPSTQQIIKKYPQLVELPMNSQGGTPANSQRMSDDEPILEQTIGSLIKNQTSAMLNQYSVGANRIYTRKSVQKFFREAVGLSQNEIQYCIQHFNSYDNDLDGILSNEQLTMMVLKLYCCQMVLEKLHASGKLKQTKERILSQEDFILLIETAFSYLFFRPRREDLIIMFRNMDTKNIGYIPYSFYGQFIEKYLLMERFDKDSSMGFGIRDRKTTQATSPGGYLASSHITSEEDRDERRPLQTTRSTFLKL